jgi:hypothetical protein
VNTLHYLSDCIYFTKAFKCILYIVKFSVEQLVLIQDTQLKDLQHFSDFLLNNETSLFTHDDIGKSHL